MDEGPRVEESGLLRNVLGKGEVRGCFRCCSSLMDVIGRGSEKRTGI